MGFIGINNILPYAIIKPPRINEAILPEKIDLKSEPLDLKTKDDIELSGYWIKSELDFKQRDYHINSWHWRL